MIRKNLLLMALCLLFSVSFIAVQAQVTVSGKVVDDSNFGVPGVSVVVKGTTVGTTTDFDGNFALDEVPSDATLVFSFVGMLTQEVSVNGQTTLNVTMQEDFAELEEVVVIGYGTVKKKDATGAVDAIGADEFTAVNAVSPADMLRGKVAGVQITQSSGEPGGAIKIRVRGNSSVRSGNEPLIVIDGVPLSGGNSSLGSREIKDLGISSAKSPLNFINENDIESINILKDAASTAIYGSRGANGVIVITTKRGKSGAPKVNFNTTVGFSSIKDDLDMLSSDRFVDLLTAAGGSSSFDFGDRGYDWTDAILQTAVSQSNSLDVTFGNDKSSNRVSISTLSQEGIVKKTKLDRYSLNLTNNVRLLNDILTIDTKFLTSQTKDKSQLITKDAGFIGNTLSAALYWNPTRNLRQSDGSYTQVDETYLNPLEMLEGYDDNTNTTQIIGSISPQINLSKLFNMEDIGDLSYKLVFGIEYSTSERASQLLPSINVRGHVGETVNKDPAGGFAAISNLHKWSKTFENILTYKEDFEKFGLNALLGYSYYQYNYKDNYTTARLFNENQTNLIDNLEGGKQGEHVTGSSRNQTEMQSFFGRLEGSFLENRLIVTASFRVDGSTRPAHDERYGYFPAVGAAYKIFDNSDDIINNLKIRANWGITGNTEFDVNASLATFTYNNSGGTEQVLNSNSELKWETTTSYGIGVDFDLIDRKLSASFDYYYRETEDLILPTSPEGNVPNPATKKFINSEAVLENTGFEIGLNFNAITKEKFSLSFNFNAAFLDNEMKNFSGFIQTGEIHGQGLSGAYAQIVTNNQPLYTYFLREWRRFDSEGNSVYADAVGQDTDLGLASVNITGKSALPTTTLGFSIYSKYNDFDFNLSLSGAFGHYIYNNTRNALFTRGSFLGGRNVPSDIASSKQSVSDPNSPSTLFLEKGDYLKFSNITLGYTFKDLTEWISSIRVFISGSNLLTITDYSGFDPEVDTDKTFNDIPSAGMDYLSYPSSKTFTFGLNVSF